VEPAVFKLRQSLVEEMFAHARSCAPEECCGLLGGEGGRAVSVYPLRNVAARPEVAYEAAPEQLFEAQRRMRARGEALAGVYHSHPRSKDPEPSQADVRLAFYPEAFYFIIGFGGEGECVLRAFRISEREGRWEPAPFEVGG
jgi:[CysO sulfur-carrier protein]-S-L-cysteine hydrolase